MPPLYVRLVLSLALFRVNRRERARQHLCRAEENWRRGEVLRAIPHAVATTALAPTVAFYVGIYPGLRSQGRGSGARVLDRLGQLKSRRAQTSRYLGYTACWSDGWVGPRLVVECENGLPARSVSIRGWADLRYLNSPLVLTVRLDSHIIGQHRLEEPGDFVARIPVPDPVGPGTHTIEVEASSWFVPHRFTENGDSGRWRGAWATWRSRKAQTCCSAIRRAGAMAGSGRGWSSSARTGCPLGPVSIRGWADLRYLNSPLVLTVRLDSHIIGQHRLEEPGDFVARIPVPDPVDPGTHTIEVEASSWFVPHRFTENGDFRPLAWRLADVELDAGPAAGM